MEIAFINRFLGISDSFTFPLLYHPGTISSTAEIPFSATPSSSLSQLFSPLARGGLSFFNYVESLNSMRSKAKCQILQNLRNTRFEMQIPKTATTELLDDAPFPLEVQPETLHFQYMYNSFLIAVPRSTGKRLSDMQFSFTLAILLNCVKPVNLVCTNPNVVPKPPLDTSDKFLSHISCCSSCGRHLIDHRHEVVNILFSTSCKKGGVHFLRDPKGLYKDPAKDGRTPTFNGKEGPDGMFTTHRGVFVSDVSIAHQPKFWYAKDHERNRVLARLTAKKKEYANFIKLNPSISFAPLVCSTFGVLESETAMWIVETIGQKAFNFFLSLLPFSLLRCFASACVLARARKCS